MSVESGLCLEDVGALLLGPSSLTADPSHPLLDEDEESTVSGRPRSPLSSSSSLSTLAPSPPAAVGCMSELLSWLSPSELLGARAEPEMSEGTVFSGMDWMTERLDLSDFDLDSLIGSCDSEEPPGSPEELLACLETDMDLDLQSLPFSASELGLTLPLELPLPEPVEIKSEPPSPAPSSTLDLGSEVSVVLSPAVIPNMTPFHIVVVLSPKVETCTGDSSDSDSGISVSGSPTHQLDPKPASSSRAKPYSRPDPAAGRVKAGPGAPKVEKKLKKMEQNKTAATRYRQKKRVEQETLNSECLDLEKRNRELAEKVESLSREIKYLKDLMEEVRSAKHRRSKVSGQAPAP